MKTINLQQITALLFSLLLSAVAWAAPISGTPYNTDPQNEYVQDSTTDAIGGVNMVLCIMNAMNMSGSGMINVGPYVALIDMNKCQSHGNSSSSSSGSSGASASVNYMTAVVNVTRADSTSPMIANIWMSMTDQGGAQDIYVKLTATSAPADVPPYGVFRLDYAGVTVPGGTQQMIGYIDSASGSLQYYETGSNSSNVALNMAASSTTSGNGAMTVGSPAATFNFNFNTDYFRRSPTTANGQCFDRLKAHAGKSVWRYGTYKDSDGSRVDQANPSFQITGTYSGSSHYGYASYYGIGFQGLDLNGITDGLVAGLVVTDQRPGHTSDTFSLSKVGGKLTKWSKVDTTLDKLDGIPFTFYGNLTGLTAGNTAAAGWGNWQMQWNNGAANFTVTGVQTCGMSGCTLASMTPVATVTTNAFDAMSISGWSDSFGGNMNIPSKGSPHAGGDTVSYFSQSIVVPGTAIPTLYCLSNCPDTASVAAANTGAAGSPFGGTTATQWGSAPNAASTVSYTFDAGGLKEAGTAMIVTNAAYFVNNPNYQWGVQTGRLFDAAFASCTGGAPVCEPSAPAVYYTWSTSTNQWNQSMWLTRTSASASGGVGTVVTFDPPQNISYAVTTGPWAGKTIQLQFNGFGNLNGIPGYCVSPADNSVVDCSTLNSRYVPMFAIPDGDTMTLNGTLLVVKALDAELRLNDLGVVGTDAAATTACGTGMSLATSLVPPVGGTHDVSPGGAYYIGVKPAASNSSPKVIDGVVQY